MRIAIVDDLDEERKLLHKKILHQMKQTGIEGEVFLFPDGSSFLAEAKARPFSLVFLDIYMDGENGIETAESLRKFDADCTLVFTTTSTDHALDGFRVRAFHYLVKPVADSELDSLFQELKQQLPAEDRWIEIRTLDGPYRLRLQEIVYADHFRHRIHIHTDSGREFVTRQTFHNFSESLEDDRFFLCGRGSLVNLEHAQDFDGSCFRLDTGDQIPVSRALIKDARLAFGDFLFKRGHR